MNSFEYKRNVKQFTSKDFPAFTVCNQHLFEKFLFKKNTIDIYDVSIEKTYFIRGYDKNDINYIKILNPNSNRTTLFTNSNQDICTILKYIIMNIVNLNKLDPDDPTLNRSRLLMNYFSKYLDVNDINELYRRNKIHESLQGEFYSLIFLNFQTTTMPF